MDDAHAPDRTFALWRRAHLGASFGLGLLGVSHAVLTWFRFDAWTPDAAWFLGTGIAILLVAAVNYSHIGLEPCRQPTVRLVPPVNWVFLVFGIAVAWTLPQSQVFALVVLVGVSIIASRWTLPGPH